MTSFRDKKRDNDSKRRGNRPKRRIKDQETGVGFDQVDLVEERERRLLAFYLEK